MVAAAASYCYMNGPSVHLAEVRIFVAANFTTGERIVAETGLGCWGAA